MLHDPSDTIIAVSSPLGPSALGVLRLSGADAIAYTESLLESPRGEALKTLDGFRQLAVRLRGPAGALPARLAVFRSPRSFTGEDLVELSVPGSIPLLAAVLRRFLGIEGARASSRLRPAAPGEFTLRAFLNGKLDLSQAEAIGRLIHAGGRDEARAAYRQVGGRLRREVETIEAALTEPLALVEAGLDFPDEDIPVIAPESVAAKIAPIRDSLHVLLKSTALRLPERGTLRVVLLGLPNAGKSSLVNALVGRAVALVSDIAGTTRDPVRAFSEYGGRRLEWVDLAGLEESSWLPLTAGRAEGPGLPSMTATLGRISRRELDTADVALWVCDGAPAADLDTGRRQGDSSFGFGDFRRLTGVSRLRVVAKVDLLSTSDRRAWLAGDERSVLVSSRTGEGLRDLLDRIVEISHPGRVGRVGSETAPLSDSEPSGSDSAMARSGYLLSPVQEAQLLDCRAALERAEEAVRAGVGYELVAVDLREALAALAPLTGREVSERVLGLVFGQFCVGK